MKEFKLGVIDGGLERKSGGAYYFLHGILKSAGNLRILIEVLGASRDLRQSNYSSNVTLLPTNKSIRLLDKLTKRIRALPFIGRSLGASRLVAMAEILLASRGNQISPKNIKWWLYPHCFSVVPKLGHTTAVCYDLQHYAYPEYFPWFVRCMRNEAEISLSHIDKILCVSKFTQRELLTRYPKLENNTVVIYGGADIEADPREIERESNEIDKHFKRPFFLYPAVDWPHKNHALLFSVARILKQETGSEFQIVLTGERRRGSWLINQIKSRGLSEMLLDLGAVPRARLIAFYRRARALLFPSLYEGFGIPLIEAMALGTPIIASRCGAIPEITGNVGIFFDPNSPDECLEAMKKVLVDSKLYGALSAAGYERSKIFSWDNWWSTFLSNIE
ncbi:MAG: glycosyltransferase family 4 protein [Candidatus Hodarchaeota archaeon]